MKKRLLSFFLAVCMIFSLLPVSVIAEEAATMNGTCGENLTWTLEDGTLTISGTGAMSDYSTSSGHTSAPWGDYCETITSAVIENGVTSIGDYAFYGCTNLASVTIPEGMVSIGDFAFEGCTNLASVTIPGSVASIGDDAFFECSSLESIYIPQNVVNIGVCSFAICTSLKSIDVSEDNTAYCSENGVLFNKDKSILHTYPAGKAGDAYTIPNGVNTINAAAFGFCTNLKSITIPVSVTEIQEAAFYESGLTDIYYEGTTEQWAAICTSSFEYWFGESTSSVIIHCSDRETPYGVTWSIKDGVLTVSGLGAMPYFKNYTYTPWYSEIKNITSVVIENGVTSIGSYAFTNCENLKSIAIPNSVKTIGYGAFSGCTNLESITIPNGVTSIGEAAFLVCTSLKTATIPVSVTSIDKDAFYDCNALTDVYYAGTVEQWKSITSENDDYSLDVATIHCSDGDIFPNGSCGDDLTWTLQKGKLVISGEGAMSDYEYSNPATNSPWSTYRTSITDVIIENGVSSIGNYAFYDCTNLVNAELPSSITSIGEETFGGCDSLESVTIPNTVKSIDFNAFYGISALADVYYSGTIEQWEEFCTNIDKEPLKHAVIHCSDGDIQPPAYCGENVTWVLENGTLTISDSGYMADYDGGENLPPWTDEASTITSIIIKNGVTGIGDFAFICLQNLEEITVPDSVNHIGVNSLARCEKLTKINLPSGLTTISDYAFAGCMALEEIDIPSSVKSIGKYAFDSCESIKEITIPDGITSINEGLFYGCVSLAAVTIPASITTIGAGAFVDCSALTDIYYGGSKEQWKAVTVGDNNDCLSNAHVHYAVYPNGTCGENLTWKLIDDTLTISGTGSMHNYSRVFSSPWSNESGQIQKVVIEEGVSSIGDWAFSYLSNLTDVSISDTVTDIGDNAFCACYALETIDLPDSVENIGADAFSLCNHMTAINVGVNNAKYSSHNGVLFDKNVTELIVFPLAKSGYYDIPDGVTKINKDAFSNCRYIERISIPAGITTIEEGLLADCDRLDYAYIPDSITKIGANAFSSNLDTMFYGGTREQWDSIEIDDENAAITNAEIRCEVFPKANTCGERVMWVYENGTLTISGTGEIEDCIEWQPWSSKAALIKKVVIENGVTAIGGHAFSGFENLEEVVIPDSVTRIDESAFEDCSSLKDVYYNGISEQWDAIVIDSSNNEYLENAAKHFSEVNYCGDKLTWTLENGTLTISGTGKMYDYDSGQNKAPWVDDASAITNVVIGDGVTHIGEHAFEGCEKVIGINIPSSVKSIGACAFAACISLTKITIPAGVTRIGNSAFIGCESLEKIDLPSSVKSIEDGAFALCTSLEELTIPDGVEVIEEGILSECSGLKTLTIHAGVTAMNVYTLQCCSGLTEVNYSGTKEQWKALSADMDNEYRDRIVIHCSDGDIPKLAYCGEKVTWTLENGTLTISGTGEMFDYDSGQNKAPWVDDASKITNVMIDDGVTSIGEYAFLNCKSLETITIPGSVTSVGFCAFEDCTSLTGITYNGTIKQLCEVSFDGENVEMQSKVIHCNDGDISYGISWTLEDGTLTVSGLGHLAYYDGIENPWENMRDEIKTVIIKSGVKSIGAGTFESCVNLTDVTIADTVTTIENRAFSGCKKLKSLNIPGSVRDIGNAFDGCTILTDIYYGGTAAQWKSALWENATSVCSFTIHCTDEVVLPGGTCGDSVKWALKDGTLTISGTGEMNYNTRYVPWHNNAETIKTVEIEDGITYIGSSAFLDCTNLENITIPSSVTGIGNSVFDNCTSLTDITYTGTIEQFRNMSFGEYNNGLRSKVIHCTDGDITYGISWTLEDGVLTVSGMGGMEPYDEGEAPWNDERDSIKSIVIKDGVTSINCNAFYSCRNVTDVTIADSVTVIEQGAFSYCESLKSLNISVNVTDVCDAFGGCTNLTDIYYGGTAAQWENALWDSPRSVKCITIHCTDKDILPGGTCGDNVTWTLQNNTLTISGAGDIEDYLGYSYTPWYSKSKVITSVVIDSGVTGIGTYAFSYFFSIQSISIPKSVTKIGGHAFEYCQELNDVVIPDGVTSIEESTFEHCYRLESITIPAGVTSIGEYAFYGCESLTKIQFGGTIAQWEALLGNADSSALRNACVYCSDGKITIHGTCGTNLTWELDNGVLTISGTGDMENYLQDDEGAPWSEYSGNIKSIVIKNGVTSIGNNAFANCYNAAAVTIPDSVKAIGSSAFDSCSKLKQISIPGGVREIKYGTFRYCTGLENIVIPDGIELIDEYAFSNCTSLKSVNIPAAVTELYTSAFDHCDSLSGIDVDENNSYFSSVDGVLFSKSKSTLLCCPSGMETDSYQIPDYVTSLAGGAFKYCSGLTSITVPDSVRSMGGYAFAGCKNIKEITLPGEIDEISDGMFWGCESLMSIVVPDGVQRIGDSAFYQCYALSSVSIPDSVQSIGWDAFYYCGSLTSIELPSGLESINDSTFSHCGALESITIPNTVKSICERAFSNCSALKDIYFNGSADEWLEIEVSEYNDQLRSATVHCTDRNVTPEEFEVAWTLENGVLTISGKWEIKNYGREEAPWYSESESITSVVVKDGVKRVGNNAFYGCSNLESVTLGDSVKSIGDYAFGGCSNLKTITIPAGLTSISYSAFGGCYALTTVNYAGTLKQWNRIDFYNDDGGLSYATIHCSDGNIIPTGSCGDNASWRLIDGTLVISGTGGMDGVYADAPWRNFRAVTNVVIEKGITKIGDRAFGSALETVYISASVTTIGESAFSNCDALKKVYYEGTAEQWKQIVIYESNDCLENASIEYGAHVHCHTATVTEPTCIDAGYTTHTCTCGDSYVDSYTDALGHSYEDGVCTRCGMKPSGSGTCGENATWKLEDGTLTISGTGNMEDIDRADAQPWRDVRDAVISVVIEDGITNISSFAFKYFSSLKSITISGTVTSIGDYVFDDCPKLESITVDESGETYCSENGVMFNKGKTMILVYPAGKQESEYQIPESVQVIGDRAFEGCSNLVSVSIPDGVTDIGYCTFSGCTRLISVNIPKSVTSISAYVFRSCESLTDIVIPDGVTSIGYYSFAYNPNLSSVIIPESVTYIDEGAFGGDDGLSDVYYKGSTEQWAQIAVEQENDCLINANIHYNYGHTHSYTEVVTAPTCTERGYTTHTCECGDSYSDSYTGALGHDYGEWTQTKAPTCTEKGEEARHCSRCDSSETNEIAPTGHKLVHHDGKAVTCTEKGWEAYDTCENCDYTTYKEISATGHNYMTVVTEPTCTEKGFTTHTCTACGYSCNDSYTDALGHSYEDGKCTRCGAIDPSTVEIHAGCITVSSEKGRAGEEVTVSVSIGDNPGITAMKLGIEYDKSKLQLVGFEDAGLEGWYVAENAVWLNGCDSTFNGVMLKLKFKILENCGNGDTEVTVSYTTGDICNYNEERVCPDVKGGKVTVHSAIPGDITGDGVVNTLDLLRLQKYLSGEDVQIVGNADINGDGVVDALDLLVLKKYLAGEDIQIR